MTFVKVKITAISWLRCCRWHTEVIHVQLLTDSEVAFYTEIYIEVIHVQYYLMFCCSCCAQKALTCPDSLSVTNNKHANVIGSRVMTC